MEFLTALFPEAKDPRDLVPDVLVPYLFDGGGVLVLAVLLGAAVFVSKAVHDVLKKRVEVLFGDGRILGTTVGYGLALVVAAASSHWGAALIALAAGVLAATNVRRMRDWLLRPWALAAQVLIFLGMLAGEVWWAERQTLRTQYVLVLSFDHTHSNESEVAGLSKEYLLVLRDAFRDVATARVVPENPSLLERLSLRSAREPEVLRRALGLVPRHRFCPAVILRTEILFEQSPTLVRMATSLHGVENGTRRLTLALEWMPGWGDRSEMRYAVLLMSLELLEKFKQLSCERVLERALGGGASGPDRMGLSEAEEHRVRRNVLRGFQHFLVVKGSAPSVLAAVTAALDAEIADPAEVASLLRQYRPASQPREMEAQSTRARCLAAARLGGGC